MAALKDYSEPIRKVYADCADAVIVNLARHFPLSEAEAMSSSAQWQLRKMAELGQVNRENAAIIAKYTGKTPAMVEAALSEAMDDALAELEPELIEAARRGLLSPAATEPRLSGAMQTILDSYSRQAKDQLNLVNTVMLDSSLKSYRAIIDDVPQYVQTFMSGAERQAAQQILNTQTGQIVTGITDFQTAVRSSVIKMADAGLVGFVDRGGHNWRPETYAAMDIRTTAGNVATEAVFQRNREYGNDLVWVRTKAAARPLCFPWQGKIISMDNHSGYVEDLHGKRYEIHPVRSTSYGEPAGLWGINCGHKPPNVFIPGMSLVRNAINTDDPRAKAENDKAYARRQHRNYLEREVREEKRTAAVYKAMGDLTSYRKSNQSVRQKQAALSSFLADNGLKRTPGKTSVYGYDYGKKEMKQ